MQINKLEQLREYIFDIEIEGIPFEQVSNSKGKFLGITQTLSDPKCITWESIVRSILW